MVGVDGVAETRVGIHQQGQIDGIADAGRVVGDIGEAHEGLVWQAEPHVGDTCAGDVNGFKPQVGHHAGGEGVEGARHDDATAGVGQGLSCCLVFMNCKGLDLLLFL
ncbi:hypothetical protein D3C71_1238020 [compost metagenome]